MPAVPASVSRFAVVDEHSFGAGGAQLGLLRVGILLTLGDSGVADFVCHAETVPSGFRTDSVSAGGFGGLKLGVSWSVAAVCVGTPESIVYGGVYALTRQVLAHYSFPAGCSLMVQLGATS